MRRRTAAARIIERGDIFHMDAKHWARLAVSEPGWYQTEPEWVIDFDALRGHVAKAIEAAIAERAASGTVAADVILNGIALHPGVRAELRRRIELVFR